MQNRPMKISSLIFALAAMLAPGSSQAQELRDCTCADIPFLQNSAAHSYKMMLALSDLAAIGRDKYGDKDFSLDELKEQLRKFNEIYPRLVKEIGAEHLRDPQSPPFSTDKITAIFNSRPKIIPAPTSPNMRVTSSVYVPYGRTERIGFRYELSSLEAVPGLIPKDIVVRKGNNADSEVPDPRGRRLFEERWKASGRRSLCEFSNKAAVMKEGYKCKQDRDAAIAHEEAHEKRCEDKGFFAYENSTFFDSVEDEAIAYGVDLNFTLTEIMKIIKTDTEISVSGNGSYRQENDGGHFAWSLIPSKSISQNIISDSSLDFNAAHLDIMFEPTAALTILKVPAGGERCLPVSPSQTARLDGNGKILWSQLSRRLVWMHVSLGFKNLTIPLVCTAFNAPPIRWDASLGQPGLGSIAEPFDLEIPGRLTIETPPHSVAGKVQARYAVALTCKAAR